MSTTVLHRPAAAPAPPLVGRVLLPVACAVLLAAALASRTPVLFAVAILPALVVTIIRPAGATAVFAFAFYLNLPVIVAHATGVSAVGSAAALLLLVPLTIHVLVRREALVLPPALGVMVIYLAVLVVSAIHAGAHPESASGVTTFITEGLLLFVLAVNAIRSLDSLRLVIWATLLAGATMGALSVFQEATGAFGSTFGGLAQLSQGETLHRVAGPIGETNRYAQILLVLLPLAVWTARVERRAELRVGALACGLFILSGMLLTLSRGAGVALVVLGLAMVVTGFVRLRQIAVLAALLVALMLVVAPDYLTRFESLTGVQAATSADTAGADGAIRGRATENLAAINAFADHPVLGVGPGRFFSEYSQQYANALDLRFLETQRRAHSLYLEMAADLGLAGLLAFAGILLTTLAGLWRTARTWGSAGRPELAQLACALALSLVAYLASAVFLQLAYQRYLWFLVALANVGIWVLAREPAEPGRAD